MTLEESRAAIMAVAKVWMEAEKGRNLPKLAEEAGVSASMLYQFARVDGPMLGHRTANALAKVLPPIPHATWLAAMGMTAASLTASGARG